MDDNAKGSSEIHRGLTGGLKMKFKIKKLAKPRKLSRSIAGNLVVFVFLALIAAFMALPAYYSIIQSLKPIEELFAYPPKFFVRNPTLSNYKYAIRLAGSSWIPFSRYLTNSIFVTVAGTVLYVIIASLAAYPLAKSKLPGVKFLSALVVWTLLFSDSVTAIPRYVVVAGLGMIDTYFAILVPALAGSFGVFLMKQFMSNAIPDSVIEAARIDGAGEFSIFWKIIMPCIKPAWLTLTIFTFQSMWSATGGSYIFSEELKTLPSVLSTIAGGGIARSGAGSAVAVILMLPPVIIFIISQSSIMDTMAHSGLK